MTARQLTLAQTFNPSEASQQQASIVWQVHGPRRSVLIGRFGTKNEGRRARGIVALDLDGTLITPKSGRRYPRDIKDWCWLYGGPKGTLITDKMSSQYDEGYDVCVISNQKFTPAHKSADLHIASLKEKLADIFATSSVPLNVYCALADDEYRKPRIGLIELINPTGTDNLYVGDAAGRQKDHSACDYQWALNANWKFMTPEMFFLKRQSDLPQQFDFDPRPLQFCEKPILSDLLRDSITTLKSPTVFVLMGPPGCGKSFLARTVLSDCMWLNQDVLKDKTKLLRLLKQHLSQGASVVVDRMNASTAQRRPFIDVAKEKQASIVCIFLQISKALAQHGNIFRMLCKTSREHRDESVPTLAYNMYYKELEEPREEEGFTRIISIKSGDYSFGPFESVSDSRLFFQFLR